MTLLFTLCVILGLLMLALAFILRPVHVKHNFRTGPISIIIGTGWILVFFVVWAGLTPGPVDPFDAARALAWLDIAAGAGAVLAWGLLAWQVRREIGGADRAEAEAQDG